MKHKILYYVSIIFLIGGITTSFAETEDEEYKKIGTDIRDSMNHIDDELKGLKKEVAEINCALKEFLTDLKEEEKRINSLLKNIKNFEIKGVLGYLKDPESDKASYLSKRTVAIAGVIIAALSLLAYLGRQICNFVGFVCKIIFKIIFKIIRKWKNRPV